MSWLKGSRCGVENCRSRVWRVVDGQRICQNGHVKEGDIEIGEDDDQFMGTNVIRPSQMSQPTASFKSKEQEILYGKESIGLLMQSLQFLLRKQIQWMRDQQGLPAEYEAIVKALWTMVVNKVDFYEAGAEEETVEKVKHEEERSGSDGSELEDVSDDELRSTPIKHEKVPSKQLLERISYIHTVALCYLGCVILRIPVYLYDFNRWIYRYQFPYMKGFQLLPSKMRKSMSGFTVQLLTPRGTPSSDQLYESVYSIHRMLYNSYKLVLPTANWKPLLFKMIHDMFLSPEIYFAAEILVEKLDFTMELPRGSVYQKKTDPEIFLMAVIIICMKLCYGLDGETRLAVENKSWTPSCFQYPWDVYSDMLRKIWIEDENFSSVHEREVMFWEKGKIERYLSWFQENMIEKEENMSVSKERLFSMFPLGETKENAASTDEFRHSISTVETIDEILRLLQETLVDVGNSKVNETTSREQTGGEQQSSDENMDIDGDSDNEKEHLVMSPGERYQSFRIRSELPEIIDVIFQTSAKLTGTKPETIKQVVSSLEISCRKIFVGMNGGGNNRRRRQREDQDMEL